MKKYSVVLAVAVVFFCYSFKEAISSEEKVFSIDRYDEEKMREYCISVLKSYAEGRRPHSGQWPVGYAMARKTIELWTNDFIEDNKISSSLIKEVWGPQIFGEEYESYSLSEIFEENERLKSEAKK